VTYASPIDTFNPALDTQGLAAPDVNAPLFTLDNPPALLAQARPPSRGQSWTDILGSVGSAALPDAIVYSNAALLAPANAKSFVLVNPLAGGYTHFISHPQNTVNVGGVPFGRVEAVHYNTNGTGTRREDGFGRSWKLGSGQNQVTVFINGRLGDTNLNNASNGASVNFGFFGSPAALRQLVDQLPAGGRAGKVKEAIEALLATASAGGQQLGLAWRGTLQLNRDTGQLDLNVSGVRIPLADLQAALQDVNAINYGNKPIARVNNEEAYLNGANPFQRADDTRVPGGPYVNHGDPVAAIAGDILALQDRLDQLDGLGSPNIRTNDQARRFLEGAIGRSTWLSPEERRRQGNISGIEDIPVSERAMAPEDRAKLQGLLVQLHRYGLYFGSPTIEAAARSAASLAPTQGTPEDRAFVRDVFQGKFRHASLDGYDAGDLARDITLGLNRWTAALSILDAGGTARDDIMLDQSRNRLEGFQQRMNREGGTLAALNLRLPAGVSAADAEALATSMLASELAPQVRAAGRELSAQSLYEQFQRLGAAQRSALAREIQGELDQRGSGQVRRSGERRVIDGVAVVGGVSRVEDVGGVNRSTGQALQGTLMWGRSENGTPVFWLQGRSTNYVLRDGSGALVTNQADAEARARELIRNGGATDLRPLDVRYVTPAATTPSPSSNNRTIGGIEITGTPSRVEAVGGINRHTGQALQGDLMWARQPGGELVFWLQGRGTNYVLRDAGGALITNQADAEVRARELISNGGATDLRPLPAQFR
jgi:hypothetical protein